MGSSIKEGVADREKRSGTPFILPCIWKKLPVAGSVNEGVSYMSYMIKLKAASSAITVTSLCSCKIDAGTDGVIGP